MAIGTGLEFRLLGGFSVRRSGEEIPAPELGGRLGRTLIRFLLTRGTVVPVDVLAESLWPDRQPADPAANVAVLVSRVRRSLGSPRLIAAATGGYLLTGGDSCTVDAECLVGVPVRVGCGRNRQCNGCWRASGCGTHPFGERPPERGPVVLEKVG